MSRFISDPVINLTLIALIVMGGLGFVVVTDIFNIGRLKEKRALTRYSKLVLTTTAVLIGIGLLVVFPFELNNPDTLGAEGVDTAGKIFGGIFQAITPRTAGFSTIDQGALTPACQDADDGADVYWCIAGRYRAAGIKTTTVAVVLSLCCRALQVRKMPTL